jgi:hypothetical protein
MGSLFRSFLDKSFRPVQNLLHIQQKKFVRNSAVIAMQHEMLANAGESERLPIVAQKRSVAGETTFSIAANCRSELERSDF